MNRKVLLTIVLVTLLIVLVIGCSEQNNEVNETFSEAKIKEQMNKWTEAWETKNADNFNDTMVSDGINFTVSNELEKKDLTIEQFISFATELEFSSFWNNCTISIIEIDSVNISNNSATLHGEWTLGDDMAGYKFPTEVHFVKSNDTWLITTINLGEPSEYYEGDENEPFDPERHDSYVSFKVDGELYVFHDQYGGHSPNMSSIVTYNNNFTIDVYDYDTNERFILDFIWEGENAGELTDRRPVRWRPTGDWDSSYDNAGPDFTAKMEKYDLENGLVKGTFSGDIYNDNEESVSITEGFFYIEHEFNLPEVTIDNPTDGETVSGDVIISGTATDESELIDVNVSVEESFGENPEEIFDREEADGTNNWSFTFDSTEYSNGEYNVEVFARDEHYNYSLVKSITINIAN